MEKLSKSFIPTNPIGLIAFFSLTIEIFAGLILGIIQSNYSEYVGYLIAFIIIFPILSFSLFAYIILRRHEILYAPDDFKNDESFIYLIGNRLNKTEKRIEALSIDISGDDSAKISDVVKELYLANDFEAIYNLIKGILKSRRYNLAISIVKMFDLQNIGEINFRSKITTVIGVCHAMIGENEEAIRLLKSVNFSISSALALASVYKKMGNNDYVQLLNKAKKADSDNQVDRLLDRHYPNLADHNND